MANILALEQLFNDVEARFVADGTGVPNVFGWREPAHRGAQQNRICWVPGDPSGAVGAVGSAKWPGQNPRSIGTLEETFTVFVEGRDEAEPENELAQYRAARHNFDAWFRAAYLSMRNLLVVKSAAWLVDRTTRRNGATIRAVCTIEAMIPDAAYPVVPRVEGEAQTNAYTIVDMQLDSDGGPATTDEDLIVGTEPPQVLAATTEPVTLAGEQTVDGVALVAGDRVLVSDQVDGSENGLYVVAVGAWTRAPDADESSELFTGYFVHVQSGTVNGDSGWQLTTPGTIIVGTTVLTFERVSP